ncbi:acyltransferase [Treponema pectinovorum]|uniref:acyltransferase family protein n=1 Tax=Treponema pectinovorum TaxID=164 RepID=UPI003D9035BC
MRKHYLDNIRWITVVVVALYHVIYMYNAEEIPGVVGKITNLDVQYYDFFLYAVYPWIMMMLFIVSGISSRLYLEKNSDSEFIKSRTTKLLVPSTVGLFAFQFIQGFLNASISGVFINQEMPFLVKVLICILSGIGVLWYIQLLWIFCVALVFVRKIEKDRLWNLCKSPASQKTSIINTGKTALNIIAMFLIMLIAAQVLNTPQIVVYRFGLYGAAFLLGYFVFSHDEVIEKLKKAFVPLLVIAVGLGIAFCIINFGKNYADKPVNCSLLFVAYGYFSCLAILSGFSKYFDFENNFTCWMNKRSFALYVFHYLGISFVAVFLTKPGLIPAFVTYPLSLIASFVLSYLLNEIVSRLPFFRWAVLGIKKKKNSSHVSPATNGK